MRLSISFIAVSLSAGLASAADIPLEVLKAPPQAPLITPAPTPVFNSGWAGGYIGATLNWNSSTSEGQLKSSTLGLAPNGFLSANTLADDPNATNLLTQTSTFTGGGAVKAGSAIGGTIFGGYNFQTDDFVYGLEGDITGTLANSKLKSGGGLAVNGIYAHPQCNTCFGDTGSASGVINTSLRDQQTWDGSLRVRGGFLANPDVLLFATAGLAFGQFQHAMSTDGAVNYIVDWGPDTQATWNVRGSVKNSPVTLGWTVGAGVEMRVASGWNFRAEYRFADFGSRNLTGSTSSTCTNADPTVDACAVLGTRSGSVTSRFQDGFHSVRLGLSYSLSAPVSALLARY